jgi:hypothetical protein
MTNPYSGTTLSDARVRVFIDDANWDAVLEERQRCYQTCWPSAYLRKGNSVEVRYSVMSSRTTSTGGVEFMCEVQKF